GAALAGGERGAARVDRLPQRGRALLLVPAAAVAQRERGRDGRAVEPAEVLVEVPEAAVREASGGGRGGGYEVLEPGAQAALEHAAHRGRVRARVEVVPDRGCPAGIHEAVEVAVEAARAGVAPRDEQVEDLLRARARGGRALERVRQHRRELD